MLIVLASAFLIVTGGGGSPAGHLAEPGRPDQCDVTLTLRVTASGQEFLDVAGRCGGHAPTAAQVSRLVAPLTATPR